MTDTEVIEVAIESETIALGDFLQWAGVCGTGGQAKVLLQQGLVELNGDRETRRSHHVAPGDVVCVQGGRCYRVAAD